MNINSSVFRTLVTTLLITPIIDFSALPLKAQAPYDRTSDQHTFTVFMQDGGWCWFQDPRAIIHDEKFILGSVKGNGSGSAFAGVYDLRHNNQLGKVMLKDDFDHDDHNAPVFYTRPDGRILAVYARHHLDKFHHYRISEPDDPLRWREEMTYGHDYPGADNVTYMNLYYMEKEGKLYNFFRGTNFDPSFITSTDHGMTWGEPTHLIASEIEGRHRPYARYTGDGTQTVHISFTDAHPHMYGNSIHYAAFRSGKFYRVNGDKIKDLSREGPLKPRESEQIFKGSGQKEDQMGISAHESAWTSSISIDENGFPHIAYTLYISNHDHRYRIASWNGEKWIDREVAFGGKCLYTQESSYTGLITLDPKDPSVVVISTDVNPRDGTDKGGKHEIYRASVGPDDDIATIRWEAITENSPVRNLRPIIVCGEGYRVICWLRGQYNTYTDYDLDAVGFIEK